MKFKILFLVLIFFTVILAFTQINSTHAEVIPNGTALCNIKSIVANGNIVTVVGRDNGAGCGPNKTTVITLPPGVTASGNVSLYDPFEACDRDQAPYTFNDPAADPAIQQGLGLWHLINCAYNKGAILTIQPSGNQLVFSDTKGGSGTLTFSGTPSPLIMSTLTNQPISSFTLCNYSNPRFFGVRFFIQAYGTATYLMDFGGASPSDTGAAGICYSPSGNYIDATINISPPPPPPPQCAGYSQDCTEVSPTGVVRRGTQWCTPGKLVAANTCRPLEPSDTGYGSVTCFKKQNSNEQGCKIDTCSSAVPRDVTETAETDSQGRRVYLVDSAGGNKPLNVIRNPSNIAVNQPTSDPAGLPITQNSSTGDWIMVVPTNSSTTSPVNYIINTTVRSPLTGGQFEDVACPAFILRVQPRSAVTPCPSGISSTQARFRGASGTGQWRTSGEIASGSSIRIAGFHNDTTNSFPDDVVLTIRGPDGPYSQTIRLNDPDAQHPENNVVFPLAGGSQPRAGNYVIKATTKEHSGGTCEGTATLTVADPVVRPVDFKIAETPAGLGDDRPFIRYTQDPTLYDYTIPNTTAGPKFVYARIRYDNQTFVDIGPIRIDYVGADPEISGGVNCGLDISGDGGINFEILGTNFGDTRGNGEVRVESGNLGNNLLEIRQWSNNKVVAFMPKPSGQIATNQSFRVALKRADGQAARVETCSLNTSTLSLGARIFCRVPSRRDQTNVKLALVENKIGSKPTAQTVTIDKDGNITGLTAQLQKGVEYMVAIQSPGSLRRVATFTATGNTTVIPNFILPVGDIFPLGDGDGAINIADKAELNREWNATTAVLNRAADFDQNGRVNSVDWACMRYDFGKTNDPEPAPNREATPPPSATPRPSATPTPSPSPTGSPTTFVCSLVTLARAGNVFTAAPTCSGGIPIFKWFYKPPSGDWTAITNDYSNSNAYTWNTSGLAAGDYQFGVWVRPQGADDSAKATTGIPVAVPIQ